MLLFQVQAGRNNPGGYTQKPAWLFELKYEIIGNSYSHK